MIRKRDSEGLRLIRHAHEDCKETDAAGSHDSSAKLNCKLPRGNGGGIVTATAGSVYGTHPQGDVKLLV
jgi:hypothetical protein